MKEVWQARSSGTTFLELIVVMMVIGALASMAISQYGGYRKKAEAESCLSNRRNIEMEEMSYYIERNTPNLAISDIYACPSGGVYVWLVSDPGDEHYPRLGCSIHYAGGEDASAATTTTTYLATTTTTSTTTTTTSTTPPTTDPKKEKKEKKEKEEK